MNDASTNDEGQMDQFERIAIIDDAFNPLDFGNLDREIQDILSDPDHPETEGLIQILLTNSLASSSTENELSLDELHASPTLTRLSDFLIIHDPERAERFFGKYLADRARLLELRKRLEVRRRSAESIACVGPAEIASLDFLPDLIFLDLILWEDLDDESLIARVADLIKQLNSPARTTPLFVVLMSEREVALGRIADSLRQKAHLSINQFRSYSKQSLLSAGSLVFPLLFKTMQELHAVTAAQVHLAEWFESSLDACKRNVRSLILSMEDGDFKYLAKQAADDHIDGADYFGELIGSYIDAELEESGQLSKVASACFNIGSTAGGTLPAPHIASTKAVRELFVRARQRLVLPEGVRNSERPVANDPKVAGSEWRTWLRKFLPQGLVVGPQSNDITEGSRVLLHLSQDCDTLQEEIPQSELSLLFVPALISSLDGPSRNSSERINYSLLRIAGKDWMLRINLRKFEALSVETAFDRMKTDWHVLALLRRERADALRRKFANQLNRPAEARIDERRFDWQLVEIAVRIDSKEPTKSDALAIPCMAILEKNNYLVRLPHIALSAISDFLERQRISQLKEREALDRLTSVLSFKPPESKGNDSTKRGNVILDLPLNEGKSKKAAIELCFRERQSISSGDSS